MVGWLADVKVEAMAFLTAAKWVAYSGVYSGDLQVVEMESMMVEKMDDD